MGLIYLPTSSPQSKPSDTQPSASLWEVNICIFSMSHRTQPSYILLPLLLCPYISVEARVQLCFQISFQNDFHFPRCPRVFNQRKEGVSPCLTNCLILFLSLSFLPFPHGVEGAGFTLLQVSQVCSLFHISDSHPLLGLQGGLCVERKATFLKIFFMKHSRNISPISLQMLAY